MDTYCCLGAACFTNFLGVLRYVSRSPFSFLSLWKPVCSFLSMWKHALSLWLMQVEWICWKLPNKRSLYFNYLLTHPKGVFSVLSVADMLISIVSAFDMFSEDKPLTTNSIKSFLAHKNVKISLKKIYVVAAYRKQRFVKSLDIS